MTSCTWNDELLWDYLHDLLDPSQVHQLEEHLASCSSCRDALDVARADNASLAAAARLDGPFPLFEAPHPEKDATIPLRPAWASRWAWAAAAALLIALALPFAGYQMGSLKLSRKVAETEQAMLDARRDRERFHETAENQGKAATSALEAKLLRMDVHGPADLQADQTNLFHVNTTDFTGLPVAAGVTARVLAGKGGKPLFETSLKGNGSLTFAVPPLALAENSKAEIEFLAANSRATEEIHESLDVAPGAQTTYLAFEKSAYQPGDKILFRSITLDRSTWKPNSTPFAIQFQLQGPNGKVQTLSGVTREGGIGGGEFALPKNATPGVYVLTAADADGRFNPVKRVVRVADAQARPAQLSRIRFFPEGGFLIAGVPTRVYFDARSDDQEPVELEGTLLDRKHQPVATIQSAASQGKAPLEAGRGSFLLTPKPGEQYFVRIKNAAPGDPIHALPRIRENGLGLAVEHPVIHAGDEIHATIYAVTDKTPVAIGLFSRGKLLAQQPALLHAGANAITMPTPPELLGVYRLAVFPSQAGVYSPVAERLGYCHQGHGLPVAWETTTKDGRRILRIRSGAGTPEKSWFAVSVQPADKADAIDHATGNGLWSSLVLQQELPNVWPDEHLEALLHDEPAATEALALYLGLQGPDPNQSAPRETRPAVAMLNADNNDSVKTRFASGLAALSATLEQQEGTLAAREAATEAQYQAARADSEAYQDHARALFQPLLGLLVVGFFAIACIGLIMAIVRLMNQQLGARKYGLAAIGAVAVCLVFIGLSPPIKLIPDMAPPGLAPLPGLAALTPNQDSTVVVAFNDHALSPQIWKLGVGPRLEIDRSKPLPVAPVQDKSQWLPAIASADGACEVELTAPAGKLGHIIHVDVFTASGRVGSTTALVK